MTQSSPGNPPVSFIDNPHAPEVYADSVSGLFVHNGNVRLTFESARVNHATTPGPINRVVIGRVVLPFAAAEQLRDFLIGFLRDHGSAPRAQEAPPTIQ